MFKSIIQSTKNFIPKVKQWLGIKKSQGKKGPSVFDRMYDFFIFKRSNNKLFGLLVVIKMSMIIFMAWWLGCSLIPNLDAMKAWIGNVARGFFVLLFTWIFLSILRAVYCYKPIRRDRLLFGHSKRGRNGWGIAFYSGIALMIILPYICAVGLVVLQARDGDQVYSSGDHYLNIIWGVVSQFADPGNLPQALGWGKVVAAISAIAGIFGLSGLAITSLVSMINRRSQDWQRGLTRYKSDFRDYIVVIGLNEQTATIVQKSLKRVHYVLVQTGRDVERQRAKLELKLDREEEERVVFYYGDRGVYEDICDLRLEYAREVYILGDSMECETEIDHDSKNMKSLELISQYCEELANSGLDVGNRWWGDKLKCHVELEYQSTYTIFKATHIYKLLNQNLEFVPFNVHDIWAKKVLVDNYAILPGKKSGEHVVQRYQPIDSYRDSKTHEIKGITADSNKSVHLIIVGMNQMGISLAMQAALLVHLPNFHNKGVRTTITFISEHASRESEFLMGHYEALFALCRRRTIVCGGNTYIKTMNEDDAVIDPVAIESSPYHHLGDNFMDIQWDFIEGNISSPCVRDYLVRETEDQNQTCTIAVCNNDPQKSIATALYLPEMVQKRVQQVLVYQRNSFDLVEKVSTGEKQWKRYEKLKPFGMIADCYEGDMFDAVMPKLVLALYKDTIHRIDTVTAPKTDDYIEHIKRLWSEEGIVYKLSNINVVDCFKSKLRSVGLTEFSSPEETSSVLNDNKLMDALIAAEHQRWVTERLTMGFRPLIAKEMEYFEDLAKKNPGQPLSNEGKAKKAYHKDKSRAHLDICSCGMLAERDPGTQQNDRRIIENLISLTFYVTESQIISRLALRKLHNHTHTKDENLAIGEKFLADMVVLNGTSSSGTKSSDATVIPGMWVGKYPVTQEQWKLIMGQDMNRSICIGHDTERHPVNMVSKEAVDDFLLILNDITGLRFSLPTKQEWRYAALGGMPAIKKRKTINDYAWNCVSCKRYKRRKYFFFRQSVKPSTHAVGEKEENGYGLCDMLGNVWEWTRSKDEASTYCFCGGSWRYGQEECVLSDTSQSWCKSWVPEYKSDDLGFRLVLYHAFKKNELPMQDPLVEEKKMIKNIADHMKSVPAGEFVMGSHAGLHVKMSAFMISTIPVKQRQYEAIMGKNPSERKGYDLPVENVSYRDAIKFIKKLNKSCKELLRRKNVQVNGPIFALPTEAQWEYAARGGKGDPSTYTEYSGSDNPDLVAWHFGITKSIHVVGTKSPNALGLYDMCGNVWEWCIDRYQSGYHEQGKDEHGPKEGITHVLKGGSWRFTAEECRITGCCHWHEDYKACDVGFRLVANVSKEVIDKLKEAVNA